MEGGKKVTYKGESTIIHELVDIRARASVLSG